MEYHLAGFIVGLAVAIIDFCHEKNALKTQREVDAFYENCNMVLDLMQRRGNGNVTTQDFMNETCMTYSEINAIEHFLIDNNIIYCAPNHYWYFVKKPLPLELQF